MLLPCLTLLATSNAIAQSNKKERWFEVEVLLFQQLGDKTLLKEQFPDDTPSAALSLRHKRFIELLTPFLKPNIQALKIQLPQCDSNKTAPSFIEQATAPTPLYTLKNLTQIDNFTIIETFNDNSINDDTINEDIINEETINNVEDIKTNTTNSEYNIDDNSSIENTLHNDATPDPDADPDTKALITLADNTLNEDDTFTPLSAEMQLLVAQAEQEFTPFKFNLSADHLPTKAAQNRQQLCQLSAQVLANLATADPQFKTDDFTVDKVPNTINAADDVYSKKPYLLSKTSLKLNDVVKQLRWSKQFKPLLHIGWRLAPKGRNKAIPLHFFAGDNLQANYQQQLKQYNKAIASALAQENQAEQNTVEQTDTINNEMNRDLAENSLEQGAQLLVTSELTPEPTPEQQYQQKVNERLSSILTQLNQFNESNHDKTASLPDNDQLNLDKLINELKQPTLALKINSKVDELEKKYHINKPQPPLQDWFVDGWFKVHLNHYLFISFDMTVLNKTLSEQASDKLKINVAPLPPLKLIEFKQDRRVISKEIHYFDNPYLGMVVQIRRHQRPEPPIDDEQNKLIEN